MTRGKIVGLIAMVVTVATATGAVEAWGAGSRSDSGIVKASIIEWKISPLPKQVSAGKVTFVVNNRGFKKHEFVVLRTDTAPGALPVKNDRASEAGHQGEIELAPGSTKKLTLTLAPGKYVLICNFLRHYKRGQYASFSVR